MKAIIDFRKLCFNRPATAKPIPLAGSSLDSTSFLLTKEGMRFAIKPDKTADRTTIIYNSQIKIINIPLAAYYYKLNGRSPIQQFMNFYRGKRDKASGITNDPNDFLQQKHPAYFLETLLRVIHVGLETKRLVSQLPKVNFNNPKNLVNVVK